MTEQHETKPVPQVVTLKDVYLMVQELTKTVASQNYSSLERTINDHEVRIRELEKWIWRASGLAALGGAAISQLVMEIMK